jgi:hypothetical protein
LRLTAVAALSVSVGLGAGANKAPVAGHEVDLATTRALEHNENTATLSFSDDPAMGVAVDVVFSVEPSANLPDATVTIELVPELSVLSASPAGYQVIGSSVVWASQSLSSPGPHTFIANVKSTAEFYDVVRGTVVENVQVGNLDTDVDELHVMVDAASAVVARELPVPPDGASLAQVWNQPKLDLEMAVDPLPLPNELTTGTITLTNKTSGSLYYNGSVIEPAGWAITGSKSWSTLLGPGQSEVRSWQLQASSAYESWSFQLDIDDPTDSNYHMNYHGISFPEGAHGSGAAATGLVGVEPFRYEWSASGGGSPVWIGGVLHASPDVDTGDCNYCRFTIRGMLTHNYSIGSPPLRNTLLGLKVIPEGTSPVCPGTSLVYWTNATSVKGSGGQQYNYEFTNVPFIRGTYTIYAYATDASTGYSDEFSIRSYSKLQGLQPYFIYRSPVDFLYITECPLIPLMATPKNIADHPLATGFHIQHYVSTVTAAFMAGRPEWQHKIGKFRAHMAYPVNLGAGIGGQYFPRSDPQGGRIEFHTPNDHTINHEYGHHVQDAVYNILPCYGTSQCVANVEGWARMFEGAPLGVNRWETVAPGGGPGSTFSVAAGEGDLIDPANEPWDTMSMRCSTMSGSRLRRSVHR